MSRSKISAVCLSALACLNGCDTSTPDTYLTVRSDSLACKVDNPANPADGHVEYVRGTLPILLVATHDGDIHPPYVPQRKNTRQLERFSTARDRYTATLAREIADELERLTGERPSLVINRLSRHVMDPNRSAEMAYEHPEAAKAYHAFHKVLALAVREACSGSQPALLVDLHGQSKHPADVCIGTHDGQTLLDLPGLGGNQASWPAVQVSRELVASGFSLPGFVPQMETDWVGRRREKTARVVSIPADLPQSMRRGGWLIGHYSRPLNGIPSMQIEVHRRVRYQPDVRRRFAQAFAASLSQFAQRYLAWGCERSAKSAADGEKTSASVQSR